MTARTTVALIPMLNRIVLLVSLLGMVLALHLWVQKERNFDQGCWGIPALATGPAAVGQGCRNGELQKAGQLLGISVATWGYAFYFFVGGMAFAKVLLPARAARRCHAASEVVVALAFPFNCYLFYVQAFVAKAFCPLCVVSGVLVTTLFVLHAVQFWRGGYEPPPEPARPAEIGYAVAMGLGAMGLLAAVMIMVNQVGTRRIDEGENGRQFVAAVGRVLPNFIERERLNEMKPALFSREQPPLPERDWIGPDTPVLGARGGVNVVAFLDPNCPSCAGEYTRLVALAERYKDRAGFYVFSRVLWDYSLVQTQALELAAREGKSFEMWRLQFERRKPGGLSRAEVAKLCAELGLDTTDLEQRLAAVGAEVTARRQRAIAAGINATPTIFVDGLAVDPSSWDERSLGKLIDLATARRQMKPASTATAAAAERASGS